ncbi:MAG: cobalamin biosynthesis protein, partial [Boseongicola sp.]|nr:cobalamin biosynthesis protein [Boseongicola sp.]
MFDLNGFEVLLLALLLDAAIGDPAWMWRQIPHPVVLTGRFISYLESTLNTGRHRRLRGIGVMVLIGILAVLVGEGIQRLPDHGVVEV